MIGTKSQSHVKPQGLGITTNSSTYGQTIPVIYGTTKGAIYLIWCQNVRQGPSSKKGKSGGKKGGGIPSYVANVDCLIGTNPIAGILSAWNNNQERLGLNVATKTGTAGGSSMTISDSAFLALTGMTVAVPFSVTIDDYGAGDASTLAGTALVPMWNYAQRRSARFDPYYAACPGGAGLLSFIWIPGSGNIEFDPSQLSGALAAQYAQIMKPGSGSGQGSPLAQLKLTFEPTLGDGPEFGSQYSAQQILYPHYAGVGSDQLDLGYTGLAPAVQLEIMGSLGLWPSQDSGFAACDADFVDMIIDICGNAISQGAAGSDVAYTQIQHSLPCADWPGVVQRRWNALAAGGSCGLTFGQPNTAGNFLVACVVSDSGGPFTISDTATNTWTAVLTGDANRQVWRCLANGHAAGNKVTIGGAGANAEYGIFEIGGVDTFDSASSSTDVAAAAVATTGAGGTPQYMLALTLSHDSGPSGPIPMVDPSHEFWPTLFLGGVYGRLLAQDRVGYQPYTYSLNNTGAGVLTANKTVMLAFKCSEPPPYARSLGNILDFRTLKLCWDCCHANGIWGSLIMDTQKAARDWLTDLYEAMNAAPVWSGFKLKSIPYAENSFAANGATYISPTAAGPIARLTDDDLISADDGLLVETNRTAQVDVPNILQIQHPNRFSDYNQVITSQPDQGNIAANGQRKDTPETLTCIQDVAIARLVLAAKLRRQNLTRNTYSFKAKAKWNLLEAMDLIFINDTQQGIVDLPVRLTSVTENENRELQCDAEPYLYGASALLPQALPGDGSPGTGGYASPPVNTPPPGSGPGSNGDPGTGTSISVVNQPVFVEEPPQVSDGSNYGGLMIAVSGNDPLYGGCSVWVSEDGVNYTDFGITLSSALTGYTVGYFPSAQDPDKTNDLILDLTESYATAQQPLVTISQAIANNGQIPVYLVGGTGIDYADGGGPYACIGTAQDAPGVLGPYGPQYTANYFFISVAGLDPTSDWVECNYKNVIGVGGNNGTFDPSWTPTILSRPVLTVPPSSGITFEQEYEKEQASITIPGSAPTGGIWFRGAVTPIAAGTYKILIAVNGVIRFRIPLVVLASPVGPANEGAHAFYQGSQWLDPPSIPGEPRYYAPSVGTADSVLAYGPLVPPAGPPFELIAYWAVEELAPGIFKLRATGTATDPALGTTAACFLRRSMFGCPNSPNGVGQTFGVPHAAGSRAAVVSLSYPGKFRITIQPSWIGKTLYFKFQGFNNYRQALQDLADCTVFTYTPQGYFGPNTGSVPLGQNILVNGE